MKRLLLVSLFLVAACTRQNKEFCCTSAEDCASVGVDDDRRECGEGLACVDHQCNPALCATEGCTVQAPTCDVMRDVCSACSTSTECARFPSATVCDPATGGCVECVSAADCSSAMPVCDAQACRGCRLDSECASLACGEDGACVAEQQAVYLSTTGNDAPPCSRAQPCRDPRFATQQTNGNRQHLVFLKGNYDVGSNYTWSIGTGATTAPSIKIHGGGSTITASTSDGFVTLGIPALVRDLEIVNTAFFAIRAQTTVTLERSKVHGGAAGITSNGSLTLRDSEVRSAGCGIQLNGGSIAIDGVTITGGANGVCAVFPTVVDFKNLLVHGTSSTGLDLPQATGTIAFTTVTSTGSAGTSATAVRCTFSNLAFTSSIAWTPNLSRPVIDTCTVINSIVGPMPIVGGTNLDPLFVNSSNADFHLSGGSPARDMANTGPKTDFEQDPRPRGARFDLGADEAP
ncbi:MAG: hypothetical protein H0T46_06955 [Deltaproteobacteria bacterium]|nr:hypothetical protein [Deltaproteobacteria bacterium]